MWKQPLMDICVLRSYTFLVNFIICNFIDIFHNNKKQKSKEVLEAFFPFHVEGKYFWPYLILNRVVVIKIHGGIIWRCVLVSCVMLIIQLVIWSLEIRRINNILLKQKSKVNQTLQSPLSCELNPKHIKL